VAEKYGGQLQGGPYLRFNVTMNEIAMSEELERARCEVK
jgi:hypothetical protein